MMIFPLMPLSYDNLIVARDSSWSIFSQAKMRFFTMTESLCLRAVKYQCPYMHHS